MIVSRNKRPDYKNSGFTIVELLIVIVVIGIIATITLLSYVGISAKATEATLRSDLVNNSKLLAMYYEEFNSYPTDLNASTKCPTAPSASSVYCLKFSSGNTMSYYAGSSNYFYLRATSGNTTYGVTDRSVPMLMTIIASSAAGNCSTQVWYDGSASATQANNCTSTITWTTPTDGVSGTEKQDPVSGLIWSNSLYLSGGSATFSASSSSTWSWDASGANNITAGNRTAAQLCSDRGNGWRLPTQKELMQSYIDGSAFNLTQVTGSSYYWANTQLASGVGYIVRQSDGYQNATGAAGLYNVRCVRASSIVGPGNCPSQAWYDGSASSTSANNCINSISWTTPADGITGTEKKDPITGLIWSGDLYLSGATPTISSVNNSLWSWDATGANNITAGSKTASQLCSERGNGWRFPTQKELMQAYVDGAYANLLQNSNYFWSATQNAASIYYTLSLSSGVTYTTNTNISYAVRCVR